LTDTTFAESSTNVLHHPVTNTKLFTLAQHANAHCIHCASVSKKPSISRSDRNDYNACLTRVASYLNQADTSPNALPFTVNEITHALHSLPLNKAPGDDGVYNEVLAHLHRPVGRIMLQLVNCIWETGILPSSFRKSIVLPFLKPDRPADECKSYRPIALTSCLCKLVERLVVTRLSYHLETTGTI
jgi:potassium voltage-gated channel Eag-related subfamily H protein 8